MSVIERTVPGEMIRNKSWIWVSAFFVSSALWVYLPWDHGGFYPLAKSITVFFTLLMAFLLFCQRRPLGLPKNLIFTAGFFYLFLLISVFFSCDRYHSLLEFAQLIGMACAFVLGFFLVSKREILKPFSLMISANLLIVNFFAIWYFLLDPEQGRAYGQFFQANALGGYLILLIPLQAVLYANEKNGLSAGLYLASGGLSLAVLFLTLSRGAILCFLLILPVLLHYLVKRIGAGKTILKMFILLVLSVAVVVFCHNSALWKGSDSQMNKNISGRIVSTTSKESVQSRFEFYRIALKMALEKPLTGVGPRCYSVYFPRFQKSILSFSQLPHSFYLALLAESGIPSLLAFMILLWILVKMARQSILEAKKVHPDSCDILFSISMGLLAGLIHIGMDVDFSFAGVSTPFWILAGILTGYGAKQAETTNRMTPRFSLSNLFVFFCFSILVWIGFANVISGSYLKKGDESGALREPGKALLFYRKALALEPFNNEVHRKIAEVLLEMKQPESALWHAERAIILNSQRARLYTLRGEIHEAMADPEKGIQDYIRSISLDPMNQLLSYLRLGNFYRRSSMPRKALETYQAILNRYEGFDLNRLWGFRSENVAPVLGYIYLDLGNVYLDLGRPSLARQAFEKALKYRDHSLAVFGMAYSSFLLKDYQIALKYFYRYLKTGEKSKVVEYYISECRQKIDGKKKNR